MNQEMNREINREMNRNQYTWIINVITNLGNRKQLKINEESDSLEIARVNVISKILKVSRYGIPCYNFKLDTLNYYLVPMKSNNNFREYYEISNSFIDKINSITPHIKIYDNNKDSEFNVYAKPFIPLFTNMY
jgi:hypothetical protein